MKHFTQRIILLLSLSLLSAFTVSAKKKVLFLAGKPSHANGEHEFRAGCMHSKTLLQSWNLSKSMLR
jgi:hypothetical protein